MKPIKTIITKLTYFILLLLVAIQSTFVHALPIADEYFVAEEEPRKNTVYFPQFQMFETVKNEAEMIDEISGRLDLVDECLRVVNKQGTFLIIWPAWYDFAVSGREIVVNKINSGDEVTRLKTGDKITLSGAELIKYPLTALQFKIPDSCLGPFWAVGEIQSVKTEVPAAKGSLPGQMYPQKVGRDVTKSTKALMTPKKRVRQKVKQPVQSDKQMKKLELELEKEMLK
jgi:hypothetical protein